MNRDQPILAALTHPDLQHRRISHQVQIADLESKCLGYPQAGAPLDQHHHRGVGMRRSLNQRLDFRRFQLLR